MYLKGMVRLTSKAYPHLNGTYNVLKVNVIAGRPYYILDIPHPCNFKGWPQRCVKRWEWPSDYSFNKIMKMARR